MRLLHQTSNGAFEFTQEIYSHPPRYAILSHTWSTNADSEVTYQDIIDGSARSKKDSFAKITFIAKRAKKKGITHFWVDNCCINKSNESELSYAILSMYQWYEKSAVCFVYLSDLTIRKRDVDGTPKLDDDFRGHRWFKRGWTLQELLAPSRVEFFASGRYIGTRTSLARQINEATGIPMRALEEGSPTNFSIATRLKWANGRETTKPEDEAYCMMGLCRVIIKPQYGESRASADERLQQAIYQKFGHGALDASSSSILRWQDTDGPLRRRMEARKAKLDILKFDMIDFQRAHISKAHSRTCTWILKHPKYLEWRGREAIKKHFGFLWIKGHPGAGKSVLMKHLDLHISTTRQPNDICISHYFYAGGGHLEKSLEGMYRSLLTQLLQAHEDAQAVLDDVSSLGSSHTMVQRLRQLLSAAVAELGYHRLFCFVDALDECDAANMQETIYHFQELCQEATDMGIHVYVCFASRYYPTLDIPTGLQLELDRIDQHREDLEKYLRGQRFSYSPEGTSEIIPVPMQAEILTKANGVFLWLKLVVDILKEEYRNGRMSIHGPMSAVRTQLSAIPGDLMNLLQRIVQRDDQHVDEFLRCLGWILHAKQRLTLEEFYFAMKADEDGQCLGEDPKSFNDRTERYLRSTSKGLAELTKGKKPRVQFIHESVRDFLITKNGFDYIDSQYDASHCRAHERLKLSCIRGIRADTASCIVAMGLNFVPSTYRPKWQPSRRREERKALTSRFPFLKYAIRNVFYHSDQAAPGVPQWEFLRNFDINDWILKANWLQQYDLNVYVEGVDLPYIFAQNDCANLMIILAHQNIVLDQRSRNRNRMPLIAAFANQSANAARILLERENVNGDTAHEIIADLIINNYRGLPAYDLGVETQRYMWAVEQGFDTLAAHFSRDFTDPKKREKALVKAWESAVSSRTSLAVRILPHLLNMNLPPDFYGKLLHDAIAARRGAEVVRLLLENNVDANARSPHVGKCTALQVAAERGSEEDVILLLEHGAIVDAPGSYVGNALHNAVDQRRPRIVQVLLEHGADPNAKMASGRIPLYVASRNGDVNTVHLLLKHRANVNAQGGSALTAAKEARSSQIIHMLLKFGAVEDKTWVFKHPPWPVTESAMPRS